MKLLLYLSVISLIFAQDLMETSAPLNPEYIKYLVQQRNTNSDNSMNGYIPHPTFVHPQLSKTFKQGIMFQDRYDLRDEGLVTPVKSQGGCGACWAFGTIASIESCWKKLGLGELDLSEANMAKEIGFGNDPCAGGNSAMATAYLVRGDGPISESDDPYELGKYQYQPEYTPLGIVTAAQYLPENIDVIKQYLTDHGALYAVLKCIDSFYNYYNANSNSYYYGGNSSDANSGHGIALVGWDDDKETDGGTGAWIAKNSHGTNFGDVGYFYISYNDIFVNTKVACWPERIDYNSHMKIYYYDKLGSINSSGYGDCRDYALIKYTVDGNETVTKIGTVIVSSDATVKFEFYENFNNGVLNNKLITTETFTCDYPGYYTFDLPTPLALNAGQEIYVKVEYYTPNYVWCVPYEIFQEGYADPQIETGVFWQSDTGDGTQSTWWARGADTDTKKRDPCVKLYTIETASIAIEQEITQIESFVLGHNFPNPFNPSTTITFDLSEETNVKISIYDMTGRLIKELLNQSMTIGSKTINWDGTDDKGSSVSGGVYLYNIQAGAINQTERMVLLK